MKTFLLVLAGLGLAVALFGPAVLVAFWVLVLAWVLVSA